MYADRAPNTTELQYRLVYIEGALYCNEECPRNWFFFKNTLEGDICITKFLCLDKECIEKYKIVRLKLIQLKVYHF